MKGFPTQLLIQPPLVPLTILAFAFIREWQGQRFNTHGSIVLLLASILLTGAIAAVIEAYAVVQAWRWLKRHDAQRSPWHYVALALGASYLLASAIGLIALLIVFQAH